MISFSQWSKRARPQQCEMAVGGKSEASRPGNFARQQARRHPKNKTWRAAGPALVPAWVSLYGCLAFCGIRSTAVAHWVNSPDSIADVESSNPRSGGNFRLIDCGKFWVRFSLRECGSYASNRTLLGHQITPALVNSNQLL